MHVTVISAHMVIYVSVHLSTPFTNVYLGIEMSLTNDLSALLLYSIVRYDGASTITNSICYSIARHLLNILYMTIATV